MPKIQKTYLLIPMSGQGVRFKEKGYALPKPAIPVLEKPIIENLLEQFPMHWQAVFVLAQNHKGTGLEELLKRLRPDCLILFIAEHKLGPGHAVSQSLNLLDPSARVMVSYCDYGMSFDSSRFERFVLESDCDSCLISYRGFHPHYFNPNTYAYSRLQQGRVMQVKEKGSFTDQRENEFASCGAYYFKSVELLKLALDHQIENNLSLNGEFYISLTVQALIEMKPDHNVRVFEIPYFYQWGTPEDLEYFNYWAQTFKKFNQFSVHTMKTPQLLLPMAGGGVRFQKYTSVSKPMIQIDQEPMFFWAMNSLPQAEKACFIVQDQIKKDVQQLCPTAHIVSLSEKTEGQAITVQLGLELLDPGQTVLITACDHTVVMNPARWQNFLQNSEAFDAVIFTVKGFPGVARTPESYAYVQLNEETPGDFKTVKKVSVKKTLSNTPLKDHLLVGTFWFKNSTILQQGIFEILQQKIKVNNEYYLDSVFNALITKGYNVVNYELDGYINWGDPQCLSEATYWFECFSGRRLNPRTLLKEI